MNTRLFSLATLLSLALIAPAATPPGGNRKLEPYRGEFTGTPTAPAGDWVLWYPRPADAWTSALPVGNGDLGAMVFGGVSSERLQVNAHTVWSGKPTNYAHQGAAASLPEIRRLLQEGRKMERDAGAKEKAGANDEAKALRQQSKQNQKAAEDLAGKEFMSTPLHQYAYQPCVDLWLDFPEEKQVSNYRRWLDLDAAVARIRNWRPWPSSTGVTCSSRAAAPAGSPPTCKACGTNR